jgi:hypothetical protein
MIARLAGALAVTLAFGVIAASPALAQEGPRDGVIEVELASPSEGVYAGIVSIAGRASSPAGIKRVELFVDDYVVATEEPKDYRRDVDVSFEWDSRFAPDLDERWPNGRYRVGIRAVANGERNEQEESILIAVDNMPETPSGLRTEVEGAAVSLSWPANPEPDILYYIVQRDSGGGYEPIARRKSPGFYEIADAGSHSYRVLAVRRSPTIDEGQTSLASSAVAVRISSHAADDGDGFEVEGGGSAPTGLSGGLPDLTLSTGLPPLPGAEASSSDRWGGYEGRLPYGKMKVPPKFRLVKGASDDARDRWWNVIPPDGLRWVAAGALLIVLSAQARLFARRLTPPVQT